MTAVLNVLLGLTICIAIVRITLVAAEAWTPTPGDYIFAQVVIIIAAIALLVSPMTAVLIVVAGIVASLIRNGRHIMNDLDTYETRTCPPVDDRTRFLKMMDEEYGHE